MDYNPDIIGLIALFAFVALLLYYVPMIFFLITQQNTLKLVQPQNRLMPPGQVWLQLIPVFGTIWSFFVVNKVAESIHNEMNTSTFSFEEEGHEQDPFLHSMGERPTRSIGLAYCICSVCAWIPVVGTFVGLGALVCWIVYWVELAKHKRILHDRSFERQTIAPKSMEPMQF